MTDKNSQALLRNQGRIVFAGEPAGGRLQHETPVTDWSALLQCGGNNRSVIGHHILKQTSKRLYVHSTSIRIGPF